MTINDETVEFAAQTTDGRTPQPDAVELIRAAEQFADDDGFVGRGGERT
jgi:plasmid replication initiation protein